MSTTTPDTETTEDQTQVTPEATGTEADQNPATTDAESPAAEDDGTSAYSGGSVNVSVTKQAVQGQPQAAQNDPDDGRVLVHEVFVQTDRHILDPNDPLAVQVPEGVGASTVGQSPALAALQEGTAEEQFAAADKS